MPEAWPASTRWEPSGLAIGGIDAVDLAARFGIAAFIPVRQPHGAESDKHEKDRQQAEEGEVHDVWGDGGLPLVHES